MLTDIAIKKQERPQIRREVPDGKIVGLYLVLQPSGAKSWALRYRFGGVSKKLTLGSYPALDLAAARKKAQDAIGVVARGDDPAGAKMAARAAQKAVREADDTVAILAEEFVRRARTKKRDKQPLSASWIKERKRLLDVEVIPPIGRKRVGGVTREDLNGILNCMVDRGSPTQANRLRAVLHRFFNWCISQGKISQNPCDGIEAPGPESQRDRVLTDDEIQGAWLAFEASGWPFGRIAQLLMLTGARRDEIGAVRWSDIDIADRTWTVPAVRSKNREPHVIPLSDAALQIIETLPRIGEDAHGYVFSTTGKTAVSGWGRAKQRIDCAMAKGMSAAPPHWVIHDLRRTAASGMGKLGVAPHVIEAALNHKTGTIKGVAAVYNRHDYSSEKRSALEAWARRVEAIVDGRDNANNVTPLRRVAP